MAIIRINNWDSYQPRKDRATHSWFRLDNDIIFSETLDTFKPDQKWFWVFLISLCSFKQRGWVEINLPYFSKHSGIESIDRIGNTINELEIAELITIENDAKNPWPPWGIAVNNKASSPVGDHAVVDPTPVGNQSVSSGITTLHYTTLHNSTDRKMGVEPEGNLPGLQASPPDPTETGQSDLPLESFDLTEHGPPSSDSDEFDLGIFIPKGANQVIPDLQGFPHLERALSWVPRSTQRRWVSSYTDTFELRKSLAKGVEYIWPTLSDHDRKQLIGWSKWLDGWLAKERVLKKGMPGDNSVKELTFEDVFGKEASE